MIRKNPVRAIKIFLPIEDVNICFQVIVKNVKISDRQMYYMHFKNLIIIEDETVIGN
jgi:hypothetical protein